MKSLIKSVVIAMTLFTGLFAAAANVCIFKRDVTNFDGKSPTELTLFTFHRGEYKVTTFYCPSLPFALQIAFRTWPTSSMQVCTGDEIWVSDRMSSRPNDRCVIQQIEKVK